MASSQTPVRRLIDAEQVLGSHEVRTFHSVSVAAVLLTTLVATSGSHALGLQAQSPRHASRTRRVAPDPRPGAMSRGYGWPLRPFNRQHVIRGAFGDPRFGSLQRNFHFGIDIPARGGTPVYAVASGTVFLAPDRVSVLADGRAGHATGFSYWHVLPAVAEYRFVAKHALIGWVKTAWGHLHFAELQGGAWVNPLRVGALTPFRNRQRPHINSIEVVAHSAGRAPVGLLRGRVDVTVDVFAAPPSPPPGQWQSARIVPALLRWRLVAPASRPPKWTTAVDFRLHIPSNRMYSDVYAPGTFPNRPDRPGRYVFYLARDWNTRGLPTGRYQIQVEASAPRGPTTFASLTLDVASDGVSTPGSAIEIAQSGVVPLEHGRRGVLAGAERR